MTGQAAPALPRRVAEMAAALAAEPPFADALAELASALGSGPPILAVAWATVELDRAAAQLTEVGLGPFAPADPDPDLGATARRAPGLVLVEPSTEGRLAATLARRDEGPCALYLGVEEAGWPALGAWPLAAAQPGPLGEQRRVARGPIWGPHILLVRLPSGG